MSSTSPQAEAAGQQSAYQAQLAQQLSGLATPELRAMIGPNGQITKQLGSTQNGTVRSSMDEEAYQKALGQLNTGYDQAKQGNSNAINYQSMRSGEGRLSSAVPQSAIAQSATSLERDRSMALNNLNFQSASSSMTDYNQLLSLMGQGVNASLGLAQGFSGASNAALGGLSTGTQMGSTLSGAAAGASLGTAIYPGIGTAIGAVGGGAVGYLSGP